MAVVTITLSTEPVCTASGKPNQGASDYPPPIGTCARSAIAGGGSPPFWAAVGSPSTGGLLPGSPAKIALASHMTLSAQVVMPYEQGCPPPFMSCTTESEESRNKVSFVGTSTKEPQSPN